MELLDFIPVLHAGWDEEFHLTVVKNTFKSHSL